MTAASAAAAFSGFARWSFAFSDSPAQTVAQAVYRPLFFSPSQYRAIDLLVDMILPAIQEAGQPEQPGAKQAGVAEFVDFMVHSDQRLQAPFHDGLDWMNQAAGGDFVALPPEAKHALLERLAYKAKQRPEDKAGQAFFHLARQYTVMGFYTTRVGLASLDFPGLKFYSTSPGCTHHDNPEHLGL